MKKLLALLLLSPLMSGEEEVGYKDYKCVRNLVSFSVRHFNDGRLEYEDNAFLRSGLKVKSTDELLYWELSTTPGKKFRFKIEKLNNKAFISGSGFKGKWRKWKNGGNCT